MGYDGLIVIEYKNSITETYQIHADQMFLLDSIKIGQRIKVLQGLDVVWNCYFKAKIKADKTGYKGKLDVELLHRLKRCKGKRVPISSDVKHIAKEALNSFPRTKNWIYKEFIKGTMSSDAIRLLKNQFRRMK